MPTLLLKKHLLKKTGFFSGIAQKIATLGKVKTNKSATATIDVEQFEHAQRLHQHGQFAAAETLYEKLLTAQPDNAEVLRCLTLLRKQLPAKKVPTEATMVNLGHISTPKLMPVTNDNKVEVLINRGNDLEDVNQLTAALASYEEALKLDAQSVRAYSNRGNVLQSLKRFEDALLSYDRAIAINPNYPEAFYNRGNALQACQRLPDALASYEQALRLRPHFVEALISYSQLLKHQGRTTEALAQLDSALSLQADNAEFRIMKLMMVLPTTPKNTAEADLVTAQFDSALTDLSNWLSSASYHASDLAKAGLLPTPFLLAYRQGNHVQRLSRYGDLIAVPNAVIKHTKPTQSKIRLAIVSPHFCSHSVWYVIMRGLLVHLDRSHFDIALYHLGDTEDSETLYAKSLADKWCDSKTTTGFTVWLDKLQSDAPDVIFYPETCLNWLSDRLAAHRLAPLQIASWGHPITTGLPTIDLYFSGELLESDDADSHYRERLIRLPNTGCCTTANHFTPEPIPELAAQLAERAGVRFVIAQTSYKFEPSDDALYADIAHAVGASTFILLRDKEAPWATDLIVQRLEQAFIERDLKPEQHLLVIPWLPIGQFQSLLDLCDVYLDCPAFSGYTTAWQAVYRGIPIVTLEGEFMRQRLAAGLLRKIGITDTITHSRADYVQRAVNLAKECSNLALRQARRDVLKAAAPTADDDVSMVRAFEKSVLDALS